MGILILIVGLVTTCWYFGIVLLGLTHYAAEHDKSLYDYIFHAILILSAPVSWILFWSIPGGYLLNENIRRIIYRKKLLFIELWLLGLVINFFAFLSVKGYY